MPMHRSLTQGLLVVNQSSLKSLCEKDLVE